MYDVIALGELLVDLAERSKDEAGYPTLAANPGGAPGNFLAALSAYGKKTAFLAKVGDDTFGRLLVGTMQRAGIDGRGIRIDPDTFTTLAFVTFDAHGDRSFAFARKPGADTQLRWDEIDPAMLDETHVFHFGSLSCTDEPARSATQSAVAGGEAAGERAVVDLAAAAARAALFQDGCLAAVEPGQMQRLLRPAAKLRGHVRAGF